MNHKSRQVAYGKGQSYFKGVFAEAIITGRNNQDPDSAAESDNDDNGMIVNDCVRIVWLYSVGLLTE